MGRLTENSKNNPPDSHSSVNPEEKEETRKEKKKRLSEKTICSLFLTPLCGIETRSKSQICKPKQGFNHAKM